MKKICLFSVILSMFAMSACSEKEAHEGIPPVNGASEVNYLSIKIANPVSTRANGFEDGTGEEGKVNTVHFFFYDKDGNPARVIAPTAANQEYTNYFVVNAPQLTPDASDDSIESSLDAIVVVDTEKGDLLPEYMLTVANVPAAVLTKSATYTKDQLVADIEDFTTTATGPFVMSNSVYLDGTAVQNVDYVAGSFQKSKTLAAQNPVTVYIERVVAKVGVTNAIAASDGAAGTYATGQTDDKTELQVHTLQVRLMTRRRQVKKYMSN